MIDWLLLACLTCVNWSFVVNDSICMIVGAF